jgi:clan AA aspartic protease
METETMDRVLVEATVENLGDLYEVERGHRQDDQVRRVTIEEALVDTGATTLSLPTRIIQQLGLTKQSEKRVITSAGSSQAALYSAVRITIQDRSCTVDVMEVPDQSPPLLGQIPLEMLDFVVDPRARRLIGNPAHGGEHVIELL